jgi:hypothetical protein
MMEFAQKAINYIEAHNWVSIPWEVNYVRNDLYT